MRPKIRLIKVRFSNLFSVLYKVENRMTVLNWEAEAAVLSIEGCYTPTLNQQGSRKKESLHYIPKYKVYYVGTAKAKCVYH